MNLEKSTPFVDAWHIMTYDYSVSDIGGANATAGNAPLYAPGVGAGEVSKWSIDYSVTGYLNAGVPAAKIHLGVPFYGHTWFAPGLGADASKWGKFGVESKVQGQCCGPFKSTFGAKAGMASQQCGTMMYSEIMAAKVRALLLLATYLLTYLLTYYCGLLSFFLSRSSTDSLTHSLPTHSSSLLYLLHLASPPRTSTTRRSP